MTQEFVVDMQMLTGLKSDSPIIIKIVEDTYIFKPISVKIYGKYQEIADDDAKSKAFLLSECSVDPKITYEEAEEFPIGLANVLVNHLLRASFLMPPASTK